MLQLAKCMAKRGIDDATLSRRLGTANSTVFQWRTQKYEPRSSYIPQLCKELKCTPYELLDFDPERLPTIKQAVAQELLEAVTMEGEWDSETLHKMATSIRNARGGKVSQMETWMRRMAEAVYKVEIVNKLKAERIKPTETSVQLKLLDL